MTPALRSTRWSLRRRTRATVPVAALTTVLAVTAFAVPAEAGPGDRRPSGTVGSPAAPARTVDVMTRNLYLGASLTPIVTALDGGDPAQIVGAATRTWGEVQASEPEARMEAVADEIVAARPAAVGLQEVTPMEARQTAEILGSEWNVVQDDQVASYAIISRFPVLYRIGATPWSGAYTYVYVRPDEPDPTVF